MSLFSLLESVFNSISVFGFHWNLCREYKASLKVLSGTEENSTDIYNKLKAIQPKLNKLLENSGLPVFQRSMFNFILEFNTAISDYIKAYEKLCEILDAEGFPLVDIDKILNNEDGVTAFVKMCKRNGADPAKIKEMAHKVVDLLQQEIEKAG